MHTSSVGMGLASIQPKDRGGEPDGRKAHPY